MQGIYIVLYFIVFLLIRHIKLYKFNSYNTIIGTFRLKIDLNIVNFYNFLSHFAGLLPKIDYSRK